MKVSNDYDPDIADTLTVQIEQTINAAIEANPEITRSEIILALLQSVGSVLFSIDCPGCRRISKKSIEKTLPVILRHAMKDAAQNRPQSSEHTH